MERTENLINEILKDGKKEAQNIINEATKECNKNILKAKEKQVEDIKAEIQKKEDENNIELNKIKSNFLMEEKKEVLKAKNEIIDEVYTLVLNNLQNLSGKEYTKFLNSALSNAKIGDGIIISNRSGEKIKVQSLTTFKKKKLHIVKTTNEISGGVIIVGETYNLNFSFEALVQENKNKNKHIISKQIF